jgi:uncharacterized protein YqjF (DUF2071 family)
VVPGCDTEPDVPVAALGGARLPAVSGAPDLHAAAVSPGPIEHPVLHNRWEELAFVHWPHDPAVVQRQLPYGVRVQTFDDRAWVGLVPFRMRVRAPGLPWVPWLGTFCETNVRTYVVGPDGRPGVYFFSLDAERAAVTAVGRTVWGVPYRWSQLSMRVEGDEWRYDCDRRTPGGQGPSSRLRLRVGRPYDADELGAFDHWLTARWRLYGLVRGRLRSAAVDHEPWPLRRAEIRELDDTLVAAAGLAQPLGDPVAHWSPGVSVRIGRPERI